jgi:hypothetical protein
MKNKKLIESLTNKIVVLGSIENDKLINQITKDFSNAKTIREKINILHALNENL